MRGVVVPSAGATTEIWLVELARRARLEGNLACGASKEGEVRGVALTSLILN